MATETVAQLKRELEAVKKNLQEEETARANAEIALASARGALEAIERDRERERRNRTNAVSGKLPSFWADKPSVWFAQAESNFATNNITQDSQKYHLVVGQLDTATAAEVEDIISGPVADRTYENLKTSLISRLSDSEQKRVRKLISEEEIGDRKPSQFLRHLRSLAGSSATVSEALLSQIWLQRLPATASAILSSHSNLDLNALAAMADKIVEQVASVTPSAVMAVRDPPPSPDVSAMILDTLQKLNLKIESITAPPGRRDERQPRSRSQSNFRDNRNFSRARDNSRSAATSRPTRDRQDEMCWYHSRHGEKAHKCVQPCSFKPGNGTGSQ
ncbi:uncharacterized protein LOC113202090 [Frankliniella occidentalis]|uniref:Uncharacterized protein LOC113202090 n=1 Tax=Frankliniella occidentalis TaxID=133901 RepID=A0A6J1RZE0_FRAOC|nr:uncharacterized protein LOC113202090 [Frankliniella occidentalis]